MSAPPGEAIACGRDTIAEGIAVKSRGRHTREIVRTQLREILLVGERDLEDAVLLYLEIEKTVAEGAGAAALAAVLRYLGLVLSLRGRDHVDALRAALAEWGYAAGFADAERA